jgi:hypothetical protein
MDKQQYGICISLCRLALSCVAYNTPHAPVPESRTNTYCIICDLPLPAEPFEHWFYIHEWAPLIIFFGTYLGIVRNKKIPHVARYHIMMVSAWLITAVTLASQLARQLASQFDTCISTCCIMHIYNFPR